ncbi:hypothetical protein Plim_2515 [Planctopirus limnophila DSM 3776]|uniref:Uncharacterized protein n=1 Tax=Planctopirus limnophila (strain ATCC 43296 / DSM 3776 / IFAM 1008 / Mu 290) TaxID=521674 RepID=D5SPW6_PLAL2|nr:hypothetical protein Plim_2515 [Planctopirus limnophila DSM 3776]
MDPNAAYPILLNPDCSWKVSGLWLLVQEPIHESIEFQSEIVSVQTFLKKRFVATIL